MFSKLKNSIPNTITCLNLLSGVMAIIMAFRFNEQIGPMQGYLWAFVFIGAATVFDFFDGASARMLKAYSALGKELDSLADLVSFGVAPAMLMFNMINLANGADVAPSTLSPWAFMALFIPAMGALRLAKFNIDTTQTTSFRGLPIPACAIFWMGLVAWCQAHGYPANWIVGVIIAAMSLMMVGNLRMFSLKLTSFGLKGNVRRYTILLAAIVFVATAGLEGLAWTILLYILISAFTPTK